MPKLGTAEYDRIQKGPDLVKDGWTKTAAAKALGLNVSTFCQYANSRTVLGARPGPPTALSAEAEAALLKWITQMHGVRRTPPIIQVRMMAAELEAVEAAAAERAPKWPGGMAGEDWWRGFKARHNLRLRSCQMDEADRIVALDPAAVRAFFDAYRPLLAKFGFARVYNMDESPILQLGRWIKGVVAPTTKGDVKRIGGNSKAVMRQMFSMITCFSAGHMIPHAFILKGASHKSNPLKYATALKDSVFICKKQSAMIDGTLLEDWLDHFVAHVPGGVSPDNRVLLVMDSHSSRTAPGVIAKAKRLGVEILLFPGNCTSELQPADAIFGGFKARLGTERVLWLNGRALTALNEQALFRLIGIASEACFTPAAMSNAFGHCGLYPLDMEKVLRRLPSDEQRVAAGREIALRPAGGAGGAAAEAGAAADDASSGGGSSSEGEEEEEEEVEVEQAAAVGLDVLAAAAAAAAGETLEERRAAILKVPLLPKRPKGPSKRVTVPRYITSAGYQAQLDAAAAAAAAEEARKKAASIAAKAAKDAKAAATADAKSKSKPQLVADNVMLRGELGQAQRALAALAALAQQSGLQLPPAVAAAYAAATVAPAAAAAVAEPEPEAAGSSGTGASEDRPAALRPTQPVAGSSGASAAAAKRKGSQQQARQPKQPKQPPAPSIAVRRSGRSTQSRKSLKEGSDEENEG